MLPKEWPILFADDSPDDRLLMREALRSAGVSYPILETADGQEAIDVLARIDHEARRHSNPGLVALDIKMPRKTGLEALGWIRATAPAPTWSNLRPCRSSSSLPARSSRSGCASPNFRLRAGR